MLLPGTPSSVPSSVDRGRGRNARRRLMTRARLVAAGRRLIGAHGFDAVAVANITEEADVGVGSFYNYFRSKAELLEVVIAEVVALLDAVLERLTVDATDPAERVAVCVRYVMHLTRHDPTLALFVLRASDVSPRLATGVTAPIEPHVRAGIGTGRFSVENRAIAMEAIGGLLLHAMRSTLTGRNGSHDADRIVAEQVLRLLGLDREAAHAVGSRPFAETPRRFDRGSGSPREGKEGFAHVERAGNGAAPRRRRLPCA